MVARGRARWRWRWRWRCGRVLAMAMRSTEIQSVTLHATEPERAGPCFTRLQLALGLGLREEAMRRAAHCALRSLASPCARGPERPNVILPSAPPIMLRIKVG